MLIVLSRMQVVVVPLAVALLLSALLQPLAAVLAKRGVPPALATAITLLSGVIGIGLLLLGWSRNSSAAAWATWQPGQRRDRQDPELADQRAPGTVPAADQHVRRQRPRLHLGQPSRLTTGAIGAAGTIGEVLTGALLTLFATIFFIKDGRQIWTWASGCSRAAVRGAVAGAGERAWRR